MGVSLEIYFRIIQLGKTLVRRRSTLKFTALNSRGYYDFIARSTLINAAAAGPFIISCQISSVPSIIREFDQLSTDLGVFLQEEKFCDITLIAGNEKFQAHKYILAARSPVFAAMFEHKDMAENITDEVKIEDIKPEIVKAMVEYIYTDRVKELETMAIDLYAAGNKYELVGLANMCESMLLSMINNENAMEIMIFAGLYGIDTLEKKVMRFVKDNLAGVITTKGFKEIEDCELFKKFLAFMALE